MSSDGVGISGQDERPDEELVRRSRERDEAAVRTLVRRHNRRLYRLARGILRNDSEAEDVVQETYVRAFTSLDRFRGESSFATWLSRIAVNEALGRLRRSHPTVEWEDEGEAQLHASILHMPPASAGRDPERTMEQREIRTLLEQAIDVLPETFRAVFIARMVEGLSVEETADLFGLRPQTVKTRLHRARARLRVELDKRLGPALAGAYPFAGARCEQMADAVVRRLAALR